MRSRKQMTKEFSSRLFSIIMLCVLLGIGQVFAQSSVTGGISGKIMDPQGAMVPNASITVTNIGTNRASTIVAAGDGVYRATNLQPGIYRIQVTVSGFAPAKAENIVVEVGKTTTVDLSLALGTATAQVEVTGEAPVVNTTDNSNA